MIFLAHMHVLAVIFNAISYIFTLSSLPRRFKKSKRRPKGLNGHMSITHPPLVTHYP